MKLDFTAQGIFLPKLDLWLDGSKPSRAVWFSHAHADHARGTHECIFATAETLGVFRIRNPEAAEQSGLQSVAPFESWTWNGATLTAYPASHILGAASLLIEYAGERLLYTGDIKLRPSMLGAETVLPLCDRLIIESTFGLPVFHFLDRDEARRRIVAFARETLAAGASPVFAGYALGRGQEIVHALCQASIPVAVHGAIARLLPMYEQSGYAFPGWQPYVAKQTAAKAVVVVPSFTAQLQASLKDSRTAYVSGWAALDNARARSGADVLIPYSDHGDFSELLAMVEQTGAREIEVVHGYTLAFARILTAKGYTARAPEAMILRDEEDDV